MLRCASNFLGSRSLPQKPGLLKFYWPQQKVIRHVGNHPFRVWLNRDLTNNSTPTTASTRSFTMSSEGENFEFDDAYSVDSDDYAPKKVSTLVAISRVRGAEVLV